MNRCRYTNNGREQERPTLPSDDLISRYLLEIEVLKGEIGFNNACGFHSRAQNILLCGDIPRPGYAIQGV